MADIIRFPDRNRRYPQTSEFQAAGEGSLSSADSQDPERWAPEENCTSFERADEIAGQYGFWFLLPSVPANDGIFRSALEKLATCLQNLAHIHGNKRLKQLGGVYIDLAGRQLSWEKSVAGQMILHVPLEVEAIQIEVMISHALNSSSTLHVRTRLPPQP